MDIKNIGKIDTSSPSLRLAAQISTSLQSGSWLKKHTNHSTEAKLQTWVSRDVTLDALDDKATDKSLHGKILEKTRNESDDEELEDVEIASVSSPQVMARRQKELFNSWAQQRAKELLKREEGDLKKSTDDAAQSTRSLIKQQESDEIISSPREYQLELFEEAKRRNVIAVLDTGSGKTLVAVLLLRYILDQEMEFRALGAGRKTAFFLVNCVTLVFQQHAVLDCNLGVKVDRFCGEMGCELWSKEIWNKHFSENMAIVCTAEVLYQCLMHGFISIDQINLLIFDEAHHAKKNHPYARIIRDFYDTESDVTRRPKIFGMTASPVDSKADVEEAVLHLESNLHCQIVTIADQSRIQGACHRPEELTLFYAALPRPFAIDLSLELELQFKNLNVLSGLLSYSHRVASELGSWCAQRMWTFVLADEESGRLENKVQHDQFSKTQHDDISTVEREVQQLKEAQQLMSTYELRDPTASLEDLSSKVLELYKFLGKEFERPSDHKCIVFVQRRLTARLLTDLFSKIGTEHMRVGALIGTGTGEAGDLRVSFRKQILTMAKFRKGQLNCLFATSIAEEGLDIPDCNIVVRFDLYTTLIQYIQSRGRARRPNSKYIHMIEDVNRKVQLRESCKRLPENRLLKGNDFDLYTETDENEIHQVYTIKSTGAKLTHDSSLGVLASFVASLPRDTEAIPQPCYVMLQQGNSFICEVVLPEASPITSATGSLSPRKALAKRSAAFEACVLLVRCGVINEYLLSTYEKRLPAMRNALLALDERSKAVYERLTKPNLWGLHVFVPAKLFLSVFQIKGLDSEYQYQPIGILTRTRMPQIPEFSLQIKPEEASTAVTTPFDTSLAISAVTLELLTRCTARIFSDVFNKIYVEDFSRRAYWVVPIIKMFTPEILPADAIDWNAVHDIAQESECKWEKTIPPSHLEQRFMFDPNSGAHRYFSEGVVGLRAFDPVPIEPGLKRLHKGTSIIEQCSGLWKRTKGKFAGEADPDQPVLLAHMVNLQRNWLDRSAPSGFVSKCYICPEPLVISRLPISFAKSIFVFPSIMFRLDSYLIALEAFDSLQLSVHPALALEAMTKDSDNTHEHGQEQVRLQRGMGKNYERLELLGDSYLKMAVSISIYARQPHDNEYFMHCNRMTLICNLNLRRSGIAAEIFKYIRSKGFNRSEWYPETLELLKGKGVGKAKTKAEHNLGDKTIADIAEAIIGAAFLTGLKMGDKDNAVRAVTRLVRSEEHAVEAWKGYYDMYKPPAFQLAGASAATLELARQIEERDNYHFKHPTLLRSAFSHPSYPVLYDKIPSYQRLEFLGDALFDMACVNWLFHRFPDRDPQWLTEHKMAMVSNRFQGALCVKLGFHRHLRYLGDFIRVQTQEYVQEIEEVEAEEVESRDYWTHARAPPKALPDMLEAYIGAMFVDSEFDYDQVERFFNEHVLYFFEDMQIYDTFANNHPITHLHNLLTHSMGCLQYSIKATQTEALPGFPARTFAAVMIHSEPVGEGIADSGKNAKVKASKKALKLLEGLSPTEFKEIYGCDCKQEDVKDGEDLGAVGTAI